MRGALVPVTWRICWVQDAYYAHGRAGRAADLHQERISSGPDALQGAGGTVGGTGARLLPVGLQHLRDKRREPSLWSWRAWSWRLSPLPRCRPRLIGSLMPL